LDLGLFVLMRRYLATATSRIPFVLQPAPGAPAAPLEEHDRDGTMRVLALIFDVTNKDDY